MEGLSEGCYIKGVEQSISRRVHLMCATTSSLKLDSSVVKSGTIDYVSRSTVNSFCSLFVTKATSETIRNLFFSHTNKQTCLAFIYLTWQERAIWWNGVKCQKGNKTKSNLISSINCFYFSLLSSPLHLYGPHLCWIGHHLWIEGLHYTLIKLISN